MTLSDETRHELRRYYKMISLIREDLYRALMNNSYKGLGDMITRSYQAIHQRVVALVNDPFLDSFTLTPTEEVGEKERVNLVMLLSGQLQAYLDAELGDDTEDD